MRFELVSKYSGQDDLLPKRATRFSAGYDLKAAKDVIVKPAYNNKNIVLVPTGVKAKLDKNQFLLLANRSSNPVKRGLVLANGVGIIDSDYYGNSKNEGEILVAFANISNKPYLIHRGDRIAQGIVLPFVIAEDDDASGERTGGFGSTKIR